MKTIFDLQQQTSDRWATSVNDALEIDFPEYIRANGKVGSALWWEKYESGSIHKSTVRGLVTYIGERADEFDETSDVVELTVNGVVARYDRCDYWEDAEIKTGAELEIESFEIVVNGKRGATTYIFDKRIGVI